MNIGQAIRDGVTSVTKDWTTVKRKTERDAARGARALERYYHAGVKEESIKTIAYRVMKDAYEKASGGGQFPATARQVMYAARPLILAETDKPLDDVYFTQQLLPGYQFDYPEQTANWDVVYDARGHLYEPHTNTQIALGTLAVRDYLRSAREMVALSDPEVPLCSLVYPTSGPRHRYSTVLFLEKEGFLPLLERAQISERFDMAVMSTKGMASTAARTLVEQLSASCAVRFLVLHDFDKAGFSICATLTQNTARYQFRHRPTVVDLGLRLADVEAERLESEACPYRERKPYLNLRRNGATEDEIAFLLSGGGQRVELNAFTSDRFITWLEGKFEEVGVVKLIPDDETLSAAYQRVVYTRAMNEAMRNAHNAAQQMAQAAAIPLTLADRVRACLGDVPTMSWDAAVAAIVDESCET
jgi:hypothetical protein